MENTHFEIDLDYYLLKEPAGEDAQAKKHNIILEKTFAFALKILEFGDILMENKKFVVSNQLIRAGISIGANVKEAQNSESRADFIHKMKIAAKEAEETEYLLLLCENYGSYPKPGIMLDDVKVIQRILSRIIVNARNNSNK